MEKIQNYLQIILLSFFLMNRLHISMAFTKSTLSQTKSYDSYDIHKDLNLTSWPSLLSKSAEISILVDDDALSLVFIRLPTAFVSSLNLFFASWLSSKLIILDNPKIISLKRRVLIGNLLLRIDEMISDPLESLESYGNSLDMKKYAVEFMLAFCILSTEHDRVDNLMMLNKHILRVI